jgi:transposase
MLQITPQHQLFIAVEPVDFRRGIDGLRAMCQQQWQDDPFSGHLFIFCNRHLTSVKLLIYDGNGFWLCQKRFSSGKLKWWPRTTEEASTIRAVELVIMLQQGNPQEVRVPEDWRRLPARQSCRDNSMATISQDLPIPCLDEFVRQ